MDDMREKIRETGGKTAGFVTAEIMPLAEANVDFGVVSVFRRMLRVFESVADLAGPEHYESAATLAAILFERYMDMLLLIENVTGDMETRYREFMQIQKFRAAHRIASFHEGNEDLTSLDAAEYLKFKDDAGGIDSIRQKVIEVWGADNRGKGSYPVHWSGRKCTRQLSQDMGVKYEEMYIEAYSVLSWMINSGMSGGGEPDEALKEEIFRWSQGIAQLAMLEGSAVILKIAGAAGTEYQWLAEAVVKLRKSPGAVLEPGDIGFTSV